MPTRILLAWANTEDLAIARGEKRKEGARESILDKVVASKEFAFDRIVVLSDLKKDANDALERWLEKDSSASLVMKAVDLRGNPVDYRRIWTEAKAAIAALRAQFEEQDVSFYYLLSSGTPPMSTVFFLLAKGQEPGTLVAWGNRSKKLEKVDVPLDINADFVPSMASASDESVDAVLGAKAPPKAAFESIIHRCAKMQEAVGRARLIAASPFSVLIEGESGTGKELFARAIHHASRRKEKPFVAVNCGAIPENLIDGLLFGYEKGAFTGADKSSKGYIREADGGTLFLDEIGELPRPLQVRLLRVLQDKEVLPLGQSKPVKVDVRVIAATHVNLAVAIERGDFREDLFYRLAVATLELPPLREREGDLGVIIANLMEDVNRDLESGGLTRKQLAAGALNRLEAHHWPGNVRELLNTLRRASLATAGPIVREADIAAAIRLRATSVRSEGSNPVLSPGFDLRKHLDDAARSYVEAAMRKSGGNKSKAARLLGLKSHQNLDQWVERLGVQWPAV